MLWDRDQNRYIRYNPERCDQRFLPASTFKILNSLIALETGVIPDENYRIEWDGTRYDNAAWNQDHTMQTAFQNSVVWYYRAVARRVGIEKIQHYVDLTDYGNQDTSGPADLFWLEGGLRISADEQVELLQRLYQDDLPFSARSMKIVRDLMVVEQDETHRLSGKTGSGQVDGIWVGWFVGYLETQGNVYYFAANIAGTEDRMYGVEAREIVKDILHALDLLQ